MTNLPETSNSGATLQLIEELVDRYESQVREELRAEMKNDAADPAVARTLVRLASVKQSHWSGGYSVHNLSEQIVREAAIDILDDHLRGRL